MNAYEEGVDSKLCSLVGFKNKQQWVNKEVDMYTMQATMGRQTSRYVHNANNNG